MLKLVYMEEFLVITLTLMQMYRMVVLEEMDTVVVVLPMVQ